MLKLQALKAGSGTFLSQLIAILALPVLFRIFDQEEFADFAITLSTAMIAGSFLTFSNNLALSLSSNESEKKNILNHFFNLFLLIAPVVVVFLLFFFYFLGFDFYFSITTILCVLSYAVVQMYSAIAVFNRRYSHFNVYQFLLSGCVPIIQVLLQSFFPEQSGFLIIGLLISYIAALIAGTWINKKLLRELRTDFKTLKSDFKTYRAFNIFSTLQYFTNLIRPRIITYALVGDRLFLGQFAQIERLTSAPASLTQAALKPVFSNYISANEDKNINRLVYKIGLFLIASAPALVVVNFFAASILKIFIGKVTAEHTIIFNLILLPSFLLMVLNWTEPYFAFKKKQLTIILFDLILVVSFLLLAFRFQSQGLETSYKTLQTFSLLTVGYFSCYYLYFCKLSSFSFIKGFLLLLAAGISYFGLSFFIYADNSDVLKTSLIFFGLAVSAALGHKIFFQKEN